MAPPDLIDWGIAARVGRTIAGGGPETSVAEREAFRTDFDRFSRESDALVRSFTGLQPDSPAPAPMVLSRGQWIEANIDGFRTVIAPLADRIAERVSALGIARRLAAAGLGVQMGVLLGYLSTKVLGQYDLLLGSQAAGRVYYVGPNIIAAERAADLRTDDFRLWIALHEITHRTQFTAVPWLRDKVASLIERSLSGLDLDPEQVRGLIKRGRDLLMQGPSAWGRAPLFELLLDEKERAVVAEMQSLMTVVEGHGTFVMNRIGQEHIPSFDHLNASLNDRRDTTSGPEKAFQRAIGLHMKYEQYALGERFMEDVAARAGLDAVNKVWEREENLPTPHDLRDPDAWLARVGA